MAQLSVLARQLLDPSPDARRPLVGVALYGPRGTGKTALLNAFASGVKGNGGRIIMLTGNDDLKSEVGLINSLADLLPPVPEESEAFKGAFSFPQNGTPLTPKEQPGSPQAVSTCSMEVATAAHRGADVQGTSAFDAGRQSPESTALRAVRGRDALAPGCNARFRRGPGPRASRPRLGRRSAFSTKVLEICFMRGPDRHQRTGRQRGRQGRDGVPNHKARGRPPLSSVANALRALILQKGDSPSPLQLGTLWRTRGQADSGGKITEGLMNAAIRSGLDHAPTIPPSGVAMSDAEAKAHFKHLGLLWSIDGRPDGPWSLGLPSFFDYAEGRFRDPDNIDHHAALPALEADMKHMLAGGVPAIASHAAWDGLELPAQGPQE